MATTKTQPTQDTGTQTPAPAPVQTDADKAKHEASVHHEMAKSLLKNGAGIKTLALLSLAETYGAAANKYGRMPGDVWFAFMAAMAQRDGCSAQERIRLGNAANKAQAESLGSKDGGKTDKAGAKITPVASFSAKASESGSDATVKVRFRGPVSIDISAG